MPTPAFRPHPLLRNSHLMTLAGYFWPRWGRQPPGGVSRVFDVAAGSSVLGRCHWQGPVGLGQEGRGPVAVLVHGLEGSAESGYVVGLAVKLWRAGFSVVRLNQRNCGGTEHLTQTLYHCGMSGDVLAVVRELQDRDGFTDVRLVGWSLGGNLVLKAAGEAGDGLPSLRGVAVVCPTLDPAACVEALEKSVNGLYQRHFVKLLKSRLRRKAAIFPGRYDLAPLRRIRTIREVDDHYTAPDAGFRDAAQYYERCGARHVLDRIGVSALIVTAQNDPMVPFRIFQTPALAGNPRIRLWSPQQGGHCGFIQQRAPAEDRFWAENRIVAWMGDTTGGSDG